MPTDAEALAEALVTLLAVRGEQSILAFDAAQNQVNKAAYRWDLWAAAYLINGGCSDDGFDYFRGWLLAQGRRIWEEALADPDSLAALFPDGADDVYESEDMRAAAYRAYEEVTGAAETFLAAVQYLRDQEDEPLVTGDGPAGESFDFDDPAEMRARLPRLATLFRDDE